MRQLFLFEKDEHNNVVTTDNNQGLREVVRWKLFVDGASRNNPGLSGAGLCIEKNGLMAVQKGFFLGIKTNNQAEYLALLLGAFFLEPLVNIGDSVEVISDSELLVRQINGHYKVKNLLLKPLHMLACIEIKRLGAKIFHTLRNGNQDADAMANKGLHLKIAPPVDFIAKLNKYDISF